MAFFALLAIRLVSTIVSLSLPHAANGRFKAMISCDPVPGFGRFETSSLRKCAQGIYCEAFATAPSQLR
jgi:hypothetical protein